jgi:2-phospho-L-lactate guanylyltransferase
MIAAATPPRAIVVAPDERDQGTNALLLSPPDIVPFAFGAGSFAAHVAAARRCCVAPAIVRRPGLAFDVDTAEDHARLQRHGNSRAVG